MANAHSNIFQLAAARPRERGTPSPTRSVPAFHHDPIGDLRQRVNHRNRVVRLQRRIGLAGIALSAAATLYMIAQFARVVL